MAGAPMRRRRAPTKEPGSEPWPQNMGAIYGALRPLDEIGAKLESKWGHGRLETLVSPETAAKWGSAKARLDAAIEANDAAAVSYAAGICARGWLALDTEATQRGASPMPEGVWSIVGDDGNLYRVTLTDNDKHGLCAHVPEDERAKVVSVEELIRVLNAWEMRIVKTALETFPGATVKAVKPKSATPVPGPVFGGADAGDDFPDDPIPFGG